MMPRACWLFRQAPHQYESRSRPETVPFLDSQNRHQASESEAVDPEQGIQSGDEAKVFPRGDELEQEPLAHDDNSYMSQLRRPRRWRIPFISRLLGSKRIQPPLSGEKTKSRPRASPLHSICRYVVFLFMIIGVLQVIVLFFGLYSAYFPEEVHRSHTSTFSTHFPPHHGHSPFGSKRKILPIECASHNDYWRKEPLFSALHAGCSSVEADVWLCNDDLYVGHNRASLTPERTLQSLYLYPLLEILDKQNPDHGENSTNARRNGVFRANPTQTLVLLIDYKKDGEALWPRANKQLEPFRQKNYLTYFNGSSMIEGPITIVATGNAPFHRIVQDPDYRDIFFDAPLDLTDKAYSTENAPRSSNDGQGHSGAAPPNPNAYSPHNSYYASVSFQQSILGFPLLWRNQLSDAQLKLLRAQISGAHARGLKVRYWDVPEWPVSMRNYLWRVLVREGVDYLNVDDLRAATRGRWIEDIWKTERGWWFK